MPTTDVNKNTDSAPKYTLNKRTVLLIEFIFAAVLLFFVSESSPFFYVNQWVDPQSYFTVGKSVWKGLWPYKDLFEQKGPLLYWYHTFAAIFSFRTFFGVYVAEVISMTAALFITYKTLMLWTNSKWAVMLSWLLPVFYVQMPYFREGDSAEEFALPFILTALYVTLKWGVTDKLPSNKVLFWQGVALACVFWIKYTLIGIWVAFFLVIGIYYLIKRNWLELGKAILYSLGGYLAASLVILLLLILSGSMPATFYAYFYFNMNAYANTLNRGNRFIFALQTTGLDMISQPVVILCVSLPLLFFIFSRQAFKANIVKWILGIGFLISGLLTFYGYRAYDYYHLGLRPFIILGVYFIAYAIENAKFKNYFWALGLIICIGLAAINNQNWQYNRFVKDNVQSHLASNNDSAKPAQIIFGDYLRKYPNAKLLNYATLDLGVYTTSGLEPASKNFIAQNVDSHKFPEIMRNQNETLRKKTAEFVVLRTGEGYTALDAYYPTLMKRYRVIKHHQQINQDIVYEYWLLKRR